MWTVASPSIIAQKDIVTLTSLIFSAGFITDTGSVRGVEKLAGKMPDKVFEHLRPDHATLQAPTCSSLQCSAFGA